MTTDATLRVIADGLIGRAGRLPKHSRAAHHLRDAAAALLDADMCLSRETPANANHPAQPKDEAA